MARLVLGGGRPLFEGLDPAAFRLEPVETIDGPLATFVRYRVVR